MQHRKFPAAATGLALFAVVVVFFPTLFFGRVVSPLDVVLNDPPWRAVHPPVEVTNPELEEPATAYLPLMVEAQRDGFATAVWSPYLAGGVPGTLMWNTGLLSPFVLPFLPWLPPTLFGNLLVLGKLLAAFIGTFLLLRRRGASELGAAVGATAYALAASVATRWLWPSSGATALLPLLLWAVDRALDAPVPRRHGATAALVWLALLAAGAPAPTVVACYAALGWALYRLAGATPARRRAMLHGLAVTAVAFVVAVAVLAPSLGLFTRFLGPSGALDRVPRHGGWGSATLHLLVDPYAFGDPRRDTWAPPEALGTTTFHQATLAVGWVALALAAMGVASRRRDTGLWLLTGVGVGLALALRPLGSLLAHLPLMAPVPTWRLSPLLALAVAALAAAGADALARLPRPASARFLLLAVGVAVALEQGMVAGHLLPYLRPNDARLAPTEGIRFVQAHTAEVPWRVAPLQDTLWPDTATAFGIEDLRSQFASTTSYRRWLQAVDPQVWGHFGRLLRLNAATVDYTHPYLDALGARYVLEPPGLRLVEYALGQHTIEVEPRTGLLRPLRPGDTVVQGLELPAGCSRIGVTAAVPGTGPAEGILRATLVDEVADAQAGQWNLIVGDLADDGIAWLDLPAGLPEGRRYRLTLRPLGPGTPVSLRTTPTAGSLAGRLLFRGRVVSADLGLSFDTSGYVLAAEHADLRIWENRRATPRFHPVRRLVPGNLDTLLNADPPLDLNRQAVVAPEDAARLGPALTAPPAGARERVLLAGWSPTDYRLEVDLAAPAVLVSSLQVTARLWRITVDGRRCRPVLVNGLFVGLPLDTGRHEVRLTARLPAVWYATSLLGVLGLITLGAAAIRRSRGRPGGVTE